MYFYADKQTLQDIELFPTHIKRDSVFNNYNCATTQGGSEKLYWYFKNPVNDINILEQRKKEIGFFVALETKLNLNKRQFDFIEYYLKNRRFPLRDNIIDATKDAIINTIKPDGDYYTITQGLYNTILVLSIIKTFLTNIEDIIAPESFDILFENLRTFLTNKSIIGFIDNPPKKTKDFNHLTISKLDYFFRVRKKNEFRKFLDAIYELDVLMSMSDLVRHKNYSLTDYSDGSEPIFEVTDFYHPFLETPVYNNFKFEKQSNLCFLTGPNMSGKSTFLKSIGLLVYISHIGFPVPAKKFRINVQNGLFTTINLSDNLNLGFSHFYSEVKRVKEMAMELQSHKNLVVIFDELFRGTNVKDAFDATLLIVKSLEQIKNSLFFVSSHILEVAEELIQSENVDFRCFESILKNQTPEYNYQLKSGVSHERMGLQIVKKEGIKEILETIISKQTENFEK